MEPLAGWTIAVTAERRADEQSQMLEARGARVVNARSIASVPVPEADLRARTLALLAQPPDAFIANTATGVRSWIALAWSWGLGDDVVRLLGETRLVARGTKAAGALMSEGLDVAWLSSTETLEDVFDHVASSLAAGARVALQCDGRGEGLVGGPLRDRGFDLVELPVYRVDTLVDERAGGRLVTALEATSVDAITFTSPAAVAGFAALTAGCDATLLDRSSIVCACVGSVTATAAEEAGFRQVVVPGRSRLGPMVRVLTERMAGLGREFAIDGRAVRLQGGSLAIDDREVRLTPRERTLLEALVEAGGAVVSKQALARAAWSDQVEEHTVEVTVNRLRRKLGAASAALETSNRRGYRLAMTGTSRAAAAASASCEREVTTAWIAGKPCGARASVPSPHMQRREFLKWAGVAAATPLAGNVLAACGSSATSATASSGASTASSGSPTTAFSGAAAKVRFGFIALTDAAPIIMAKELGFFDARGIDASVEKQASWPALRDALLNGQLDAAHCLGSMPFSVATSIGGAGSRELKVAMYLSQNGQAITLAKDFESVGYGDVKAAGALLNSKDAPALAMTFPGGTHDLWLRYWVKASGADATKLKISPVPPPQMVQNMTVNAIQGYCVGEPWNAVAVQKDIGFTHLATQDLWENHPEKALVTTGTFATEQRDVLKRVMGAVLDAAKWLDDPTNRSKAADTLGVEKYVNAPPDDIRGRLTGKYDLGGGLGTKDFAGKQMQFFRNGEVNAPRRSFGIWYLAQFQRLGLLTAAPPYKELADELILSDLYAEVAKAEGITVPSDDMSPFTVKLDGAKFDPAKPDVEATRA